MLQNAYETYEAVNKATVSGRDLEATILTKAARKLKACQDNWQSANLNEKLDEALRFNQKIWSIFQGELSRDDNPLPAQLKLNLFNLSRFIDRRILETMASPAPEKLNIIIDINNNIAAGLRARPSMAGEPEPKVA